VGAPVLLHLRLEDVAPASHQLLANPVLVLAEGGVVAVLELLHDLEGPPAGEDVAPHEVGLDPVGELGVTGLAQQVDGLAEGQVGHADLAVEVEQLAPRVLDDLEGLGELSDRLDGRVAGAGGTGVGVVD